MSLNRLVPGLAVVSAVVLASCAGGHSFGGPPASFGGAASRVVNPKALQQNNGAQFAEYPSGCPVPLGQLAHGTSTVSMWFTAPAGCSKNAPGFVGKVGYATGQINEYALGKGAAPLAIAENAGYVWAADQHKTDKNQRQLYRFNENGKFTTFALPDAILVTGLAAGSDGNLWFCGSYASGSQTLAGVGYVTPAGSSTLYTVKGAATPVLTSIASGADGNIYVTDENGNIDRVTPSTGAIATFAVGGHPLYITNAAKVMVYSDASAAQLSVITTTGEFTAYPAPQGEMPGFIARKADGTVLYIDTANNSAAIGTFDPTTGTYLPEAQAPQNGLRYLFNGDDGNMWFTDAYGDVGAYLKFVLTTSPASLSLRSPNCSATFTVSETNNTRAFSVASLNPGVATVSPPTGYQGAPFTVTAAGTGSTAISVQDAIGNATSVPVSVDTSCGTSDVVYVSDNSQVLIYDGASGVQIGSITDGISGVTGQDVDATGNLYTANSDADDGLEFPAGEGNPSVTFEGPGNNPWDVAHCADGNVYIAPISSTQVTIYARGSSQPTGQIQNPDAGGNLAVHCDPSDNVYVMYYSKDYSTPRVREYKPGGRGQGKLLAATGGFGSMTIDEAGDVVYVDEQSSDISFWAHGAKQPYKVLKTFEGVGTPQYAKFDASESLLWVQVSIGGGTYAYGIEPTGGAIVHTLPYVASGGPGLAVFPADAFGNDRLKSRPSRLAHPHWNAPTDARPRPAPSPQVPFGAPR